MKNLLVFTMLILTSSCSTTVPYSVSDENVWFLEKDGNGDVSPIYCLANTDKKSKAIPICYKAIKK